MAEGVQYVCTKKFLSRCLRTEAIFWEKGKSDVMK